LAEDLHAGIEQSRLRRGKHLQSGFFADGVADNAAKFDITESESLLLRTDFGVGTDIETGPNGNSFVVSLSNNAIYDIYRRLPSGQNE